MIRKPSDKVHSRRAKKLQELTMVNLHETYLASPAEVEECERLFELSMQDDEVYQSTRGNVSTSKEAHGWSFKQVRRRWTYPDVMIHAKKD